MPLTEQLIKSDSSRRCREREAFPSNVPLTLFSWRCNRSVL